MHIHLFQTVVSCCFFTVLNTRTVPETPNMNALLSGYRLN